MSQRLFYSEEMDIFMLREVLGVEAHKQKNGVGWKAAVDNLVNLPQFPLNLTPRSVRERTNHLLTIFSRENPANDKRSEIDKGELSEKDCLIAELLESKRDTVDTKESDERDAGIGDTLKVGPRLYYSEEMDIFMLREVLGLEAHNQKNGVGWKAAVDNLVNLPQFPLNLTPRSVRERTNHLLTIFSRDYSANDKRFDIVKEELSEKDCLLAQLLECKRDTVDAGVSEIKRKESDERDAGIGDTATKCPGENNEPSVSSPGPRSRKRKKNDDFLSFLREREKNRQKEWQEELELRKQELDLMRMRQEQEMRARREAEAHAREEKMRFFDLMKTMIEQLNK